MEALEVNMYVRNEKGIIGKIYEKKGDMFSYKDSNRDYITYGKLHNEIIKASHNIIDLIEVGDYVNGEKVEEVILDNKMSRIKTTECSTYFEEDIKSIVTKEMFANAEYKVGE